MSDIAIRVERLSKRYRIGGPQARYKTIRETLVETARAPFRRLAEVARGQARATSDETIWALKDVSFEVKRGEVVGIIGRNGAGKSTLLKILSRITEPTSGRAEIHGRVGSLLEVGTGFHPELTGRENIYLNGAILGMKKAEIERKFDEIVAFSEIEKFLDTPVKHYSSGMYVRLAFAVAAHLEPEILLVDEVLAVGDAAFQKKCLGKMGDVAREGRTVLFVSHNMTAVQALCPQCVLLDSGRLAHQGETIKVVRHYLGSQRQTKQVFLGPMTRRTGSGGARYTAVRILDSEGQVTSSVSIGGKVTIELEFESERVLSSPSFGVLFRNSMLEPVVLLTTRITHGEMPPVTRGGTVRLHIERLDLLPGSYYLTLGLSIYEEQIDWVEDVLELEIVPTPVYPTGKLPPPGWAVVFVPCKWTSDYE